MSNLKIFTENIEHEALNQIYTLIKQPAFSECKVRHLPRWVSGCWRLCYDKRIHDCLT